MPAKKTIAKTHAKKPAAKKPAPAAVKKTVAKTTAKPLKSASKSAKHDKHVSAKPTAPAKAPVKTTQSVAKSSAKPTVKAPAKPLAPPKAPVKPIAAAKPAAKAAPPASSAVRPAAKAAPVATDKSAAPKSGEIKVAPSIPKPAPAAAKNSTGAPVVKAIGRSDSKPIASANPAVSVVKSSKASANSPADEDTDLDASTSLLAGPRNVTPYQVKRGEQYMNQEQLDHFRTILQSWKRDLMNEVDRTVLHMKDEAANFPDPNDRATQESEFSLELRTRDRERKLIRKIDEAINRIEDGSYGYCTETGEEIGIKRLEARPVATLSVEAQERRERRERQYGDRDDRYR